MLLRIELGLASQRLSLGVSQMRPGRFYRSLQRLL